MKITEITRFRERVYKAVLELLPQLAPDSKLPSKKYFKDILESGNTHFFIAELDNNDIIGMLTVAVYNLSSGTKFWIEDVIVDEKQRGKGYGKDLIRFAIDFAGSTGAKYVELTSRPSRIEANLLYKKLGFVLRETNVYRYNLEQNNLPEITVKQVEISC